MGTWWSQRSTYQRRLIIGFSIPLVMALCLASCVTIGVLTTPSDVTAQDTALPPTATTDPDAPQVVLDIRGTVDQERTQAFSVRGVYQTIHWSCDLSSSAIDSFSIEIEVYTADGQDTGEGVSDTCEQGNTSGQGSVGLLPGSYKLQISTLGPWHIIVTDHAQY